VLVELKGASVVQRIVGVSSRKKLVDLKVYILHCFTSSIRGVIIGHCKSVEKWIVLSNKI
jgi:hypothetical protein